MRQKAGKTDDLDAAGKKGEKMPPETPLSIVVDQPLYPTNPKKQIRSHPAGSFPTLLLLLFVVVTFYFLRDEQQLATYYFGFER